MKTLRPTLRDVAQHAKVSYQTVSRVINQDERVAPETRARVEASIQKLHYQPNALARSMVQGRTYTLACLAPNLTDYTFASIIEGAESAARELGYLLFASSAATPEIFAHTLEVFVQGRQIEGLLVINPFTDERAGYLPKNVPLVLVGGRKSGVSAVMLDDKGAARSAVTHLLQLGHQRIGMVTGPAAEDCVKERMVGYRAALIQAQLPLNSQWVVHGDWSASSGYRALQQLLALDPRPTAIFAQNDRMALGVLRAARDAGLLVPEQLAVIGLDDMPLASYFDPPLTTMRQDMQLIGQTAARLLIEAIAEPRAAPQTVYLPATLVPRRSTVI